MLKHVTTGLILAAGALAQAPSQVEVANLREDVRGLVQRVGELTLRVEQLERENAELRQHSGASDRQRVTLTQVNDAIAEASRSLRTAIATSQNDTLHQVGAQLEKLGKQTNAALDSLAKGQASRPAVQTQFAEDYAKEGVSYTVQKGDNLGLIAKKTGARQQDIINANKITDPSRIVVGQTLFIPGGK